MTRAGESGRTLCWFSAGAASAIATKLTLASNPDALPVRCETHAEHEDNARFLADCETWFGKPVTVLQSDEYKDTWDVWERRKYLAGIAGAPCTLELKVKPRLDFQRPHDTHVFGYTADTRDMVRAKALRDNYPELTVETPLIERGLTKSACLDMLLRAGIKPPVTYAMGLPNANCIPCPKATSPNYWALIRLHWPDEFWRIAALARDLNVRLCRVKGERRFIEEIPDDWPVTEAIAPSCDFLCSAVEREFEDA